MIISVVVVTSMDLLYAICFHLFTSWPVSVLVPVPVCVKIENPFARKGKKCSEEERTKRMFKVKSFANLPYKSKKILQDIENIIEQKKNVSKPNTAMIRY